MNQFPPDSLECLSADVAEDNPYVLWQAQPNRSHEEASARWMAKLQAEREWRDAVPRRRTTKERAATAMERLSRLPDRGHVAALLAMVPGLTLATVDGLDAALTKATGKTLEALTDQIEQIHSRLDEVEPPPTECSRFGLLLARGDENEIRAAAEEQADGWATWMDSLYPARTVEKRVARYNGAVRCIAEHWGLHLEVATSESVSYLIAELIDERTWRRRLRRESLKAQAWYDDALRMARPSSAYCSDYTLAHYKQRKARQREWANNTLVTCENWREPLRLADILESAAGARRARLIAHTGAMEWVADRIGYKAFFLTLTLPGPYHSFETGPRIAGAYPRAAVNDDWTRDHGPQAQKAAMNNLIADLRSRLALRHDLRAYFGQFTLEPHTSGTLHAHATVWLPPTHQHRARECDTEEYVRYVLDDLTENPRQTKVVAFDAKKGRSAAAYTMKYTLKALNEASPDAATNDNEEEHLAGDKSQRYLAWAGTRMVRRLRTVGLHGSIEIWQRLWLSDPDTEELPRPAERACRLMERCQTLGEWAHEHRAQRIAAELAAVGAEQDSVSMAGRRQGRGSMIPQVPDAHDADYLRHEAGVLEAEARKLFDQQQATTAHALAVLDAWPAAITQRLAEVLNDNTLGTGGLKLTYDETTSASGRPTRQARGIEAYEWVETLDDKGRTARERVSVPGSEFPLKRNECTLVTKAQFEAEQATLTVSVNSPRAAARPVEREAWYTDEYAASLRRLLEARQHDPKWQAWRERTLALMASQGDEPPSTTASPPARRRPSMMNADDDDA